MSKSSETRLAVLIDADNVSYHHVSAIMAEVARYGIPTIKRIYGDWTKPNLVRWKPHLLDYAISPVQQFGYTTGKNSTDSALIIDAMDILYSEQVDGFCLVSSDSDFTRLATRLREAGKFVYGIGEEKTPNPFIAACDRFIFLEILGTGGKPSDSDKSGVEVSSSGTSRGNSRTRKTIRKLDAKVTRFLEASIEAVMDDEGWAYLGDIGNMLVKNQPSFDPRNYGFTKLSALVRNLGGVEVDEREIQVNGKRLIQVYCRLRVAR